MVAKYTSGMTIGSLKKSLVKNLMLGQFFAAGSYPSVKVSRVLANEQWQWRLTCTGNWAMEMEINEVNLYRKFQSGISNVLYWDIHAVYFSTDMQNTRKKMDNIQAFNLNHS